jgi:hypothetical protein
MAGAVRHFLLGVAGLFGFHFLLFLALRLAPPVEANLVNYLWPLLIVVLTPLILPGWRLTPRHVTAALLARRALRLRSAPPDVDRRARRTRLHARRWIRADVGLLLAARTPRAAVLVVGDRRFALASGILATRVSRNVRARGDAAAGRRVEARALASGRWARRSISGTLR